MSSKGVLSTLNPSTAAQWRTVIGVLLGTLVLRRVLDAVHERTGWRVVGILTGLVECFFAFVLIYGGTRVITTGRGWLFSRRVARVVARRDGVGRPRARGSRGDCSGGSHSRRRPRRATVARHGAPPRIDVGPPVTAARDLAALPKAHLHLHFTGSMSVATLRALAERQGVEVPDQLVDADPLAVPATKRGWSRFQRAYDMARRVVQGEDALRTVVRAAAADDAAEGSRRLELQVDPTSYAASCGGLIKALEIVLDEARAASAATGVEVGVVVAASRIRHPLEARTLARLAARYAGEGPGEVVAFGLNNDERRGATPEWEGAFRIARKAGLPGVPHAGELRGPDHVEQVLAALQPRRLGHGVRSVEDPATLARLVDADVALEICPTSNVHLGVYADARDVPLPQLVAAGATVALGADDPLLFLSRLVDQYELARTVHGFDDAALADLARASIRASLASEERRRTWLAEVDAWEQTPLP